MKCSTSVLIYRISSTTAPECCSMGGRERGRVPKYPISPVRYNLIAFLKLILLYRMKDRRMEVHSKPVHLLYIPLFQYKGLAVQFPVYGCCGCQRLCKIFKLAF